MKWLRVQAVYLCAVYKDDKQCHIIFFLRCFTFACVQVHRAHIVSGAEFFVLWVQFYYFLSVFEMRSFTLHIRILNSVTPNIFQKVTRKDLKKFMFSVQQFVLCTMKVARSFPTVWRVPCRKPMFMTCSTFVFIFRFLHLCFFSAFYAIMAFDMVETCTVILRINLVTKQNLLFSQRLVNVMQPTVKVLNYSMQKLNSFFVRFV